MTVVIFTGYAITTLVFVFAWLIAFLYDRANPVPDSYREKQRKYNQMRGRDK